MKNKLISFICITLICLQALLPGITSFATGNRQNEEDINIDIGMDLESDLDASTLSVYPITIQNQYSYIQDIISGTGSYFSSKHNRFLYCRDGYGIESVCYCIEPNKATPKSEIRYSDLGYYSISEDEGIHQIKSVPILIYGYCGHNSSCNATLFGGTENDSIGGTYGLYNIDGTIYEGILIDGTLYTMTGDEAYALCAAAIHKANGAPIDSITGTNISSNSKNIELASLHFEQLANYAYDNAVINNNIFYGINMIDQLPFSDIKLNLYLLTKDGNYIDLPSDFGSNNFDYEKYVKNNQLIIKVSYDSSYCESKFFEKNKSGNLGNITYDHAEATNVSFNSKKNGYYDYFQITENGSNTVPLNIKYEKLSSYFTKANTVTGTKDIYHATQAATITLSYDDLKSGKILDISINTDKASTKTAGYADSDNDGNYSYCSRFFYCSGYQNVTCSAPNKSIAPISKSISASAPITQSFQIIKFGEGEGSSKNPLKNAGFKACNINDLSKDENGEYIWDESKCIPLTTDNKLEMFTDQNGYAISKELPIGTYIVKETSVPKNFLPIEDFFVTIDGSSHTPQEIRYFTDKSFKAYIKVVKLDEHTLLPIKNNHAKFKIWSYSKEKYVSFKVSHSSKITEIDEFETDDDGILITPGFLLPGKYRLDETEAPDGYYSKSGDYSTDFTIDITEAYEVYEEGNDTTGLLTIEVTNTPTYGQVSIKKTGELSKYDDINNEFITSYEPLNSVHFTIYAREDIMTQDNQEITMYKKGDIIEEMQTDIEGNAVSTDMLYPGKYTLHEEVLSGFEEAEDIDFEISKECETISYKINDTEGYVYTKHFDIKNKAIIPSISSKASDASTTKSQIETSKETNLNDEVVCENLIAGEEYILEGYVVSKETGDPILENGVPIISKNTFKPETKNINIHMPFTFDSSDYDKQSVVIVETLYKDGEIVAIDNDLNNEAQTVSFINTPKGPHTGDNAPIKIVLILIIISVSGIISLSYFRFFKKR